MSGAHDKISKGDLASLTADRPFPAAVMYARETASGPVEQHIALKLMNYSAAFHQQRQVPSKTKSKAQRRERVAFEPQPVIDAAVTALSSSSTWQVAAALILLTGRCPTEIMKSAAFKQAGPYQLEFSGQLKRRAQADTSYTIYSLIRSHRLIHAFTRFRRTASIRELQEAENAEVDSKVNAVVNRAVREAFPETSISSFAEDCLGHQNASSAANYEDYYCISTTGQLLGVGLLRDALGSAKAPESEKAHDCSCRWAIERAL